MMVVRTNGQERKEPFRRSRQRRLCCATFYKTALAPCAERQAQFRGATTEAIGAILDAANSMVAWLRGNGDTFQEKG
jgi:hypothetical protein